MKKTLGFTLLEMLLVLAIISAVMIMFVGYTTRQIKQTQVDVTVRQIQQFQGAILSYYLKNGKWPMNKTDGKYVYGTSLLGGDFYQAYAPGLAVTGTDTARNNPYGNGFSFGGDTTKTDNFYLVTSTNNVTDSFLIASMVGGVVVKTPIPDKSEPWNNVGNFCVSPKTSTDCKDIMLAIPPPGQNISNARSLNFAGVYHSGACVPAPSCPVGMKPQIYVAVGSVNGVATRPTCTDKNINSLNCTLDVYPVSSFSAFARGANSENDPGLEPVGCNVETVPWTGIACDSTSGTKPSWSTGAQDIPNYYSIPSGKFWRVCLAVMTEAGRAGPSRDAAYSANKPADGATETQWGLALGTVAAFTRCAPNNEPIGSEFQVYTPNSDWQP